MNEEEVELWLDDWIEENLVDLGYRQNATEMQKEVAACRSAATAAGITDAQLDEAAFGDLGAYLLEEQNDATQAEVDRLAGKDE